MKTKSKHTPGPWVIEEATGKYVIVDDCPNTIAVLDDGMYASADSMKANALLVAAAPELLEAAKEFMKLKSEFTTDERMQMLAAAIAKAEGK